MTGERIAKIWINEEKGVLTVRTPYSSTFIYRVKKLPKESRRWDPVSRVWEFEVEYTDEVIRILRECYDKVINLFDEKTSADDLFSILTKKDRDDIYRLLAKRYHPDAGGDPDMMKKINQLFRK